MYVSYEAFCVNIFLDLLQILYFRLLHRERFHLSYLYETVANTRIKAL
jgi:hypothetical protein